MVRLLHLVFEAKAHMGEVEDHGVVWWVEPMDALQPAPRRCALGRRRGRCGRTEVVWRGEPVGRLQPAP